MVKYFLCTLMMFFPQVLLTLAYLLGPVSFLLWPLVFLLEARLWRAVCRCVDNEEKARRLDPDGLLEKKTYAEMIITENPPSCQEGGLRRVKMLREVISYDGYAN